MIVAGPFQLNYSILSFYSCKTDSYTIAKLGLVLLLFSDAEKIYYCQKKDVWIPPEVSLFNVFTAKGLKVENIWSEKLNPRYDTSMYTNVTPL